MSTIFTLAGCLTYTFVIITSVILIVKTIKAFRDFDNRSVKAMLIYELISTLVLGTALGVLFQNYGRLIG